MAWRWWALLVCVWLLSGVVGEEMSEERREKDAEERKNDLLVETRQGKILGISLSPGGRAFLGIPYAEPPLGTRRFLPSEVKRPWYPSTYDASKMSPDCLQSATLSGFEEEEGENGGTERRQMVLQHEDCLYLNVFTPSPVILRLASSLQDLWSLERRYEKIASTVQGQLQNETESAQLESVVLKARIQHLQTTFQTNLTRFNMEFPDISNSQVERIARKMSKNTVHGGYSLPIMVWIHGGAFVAGGSNREEYWGMDLAMEGAIVVTFNYRLGALGFLVSTSDGVFGNAGLSDQKLALRWIRENGMVFGGDVRRTMVFGESAGAMGAGLHLLDQEIMSRHGGIEVMDTNLYKEESEEPEPDNGTLLSVWWRRGYNLFKSLLNNDEDALDEDSSFLIEERIVTPRHRRPVPPLPPQEILEGLDSRIGERITNPGIFNVYGSNSGQLFSAIALQSNPLGYRYRSVAVANFIGEAYKEQLDCEDLECLQAESADELLHVQDTLLAVPRSIGDFFTWGPVLTDLAYHREVRMRRGIAPDVTVLQPIQAIEQLKNVGIPILLGSNSHEGTLFVFTAYPTRMVRIVFQALIFSFFRTASPKVLSMYEDLIESVRRSEFPDYRLVLSQIIGDYLFRCPTITFGREFALENLRRSQYGKSLGIGRGRTFGRRNEQLTNFEILEEEGDMLREEQKGNGGRVFLYEFSLPTRTPGFTVCDGLSCHSAELPYVFRRDSLIDLRYSWTGFHSSLQKTPSGSLRTAEDVVSRMRENFSSQTMSPAQDYPSVGVAAEAMAGIDSGGSFASAIPPGSSHPIRDEKKHSHRIDLEVSRLMAQFWTTFAAFGDPNGQFSLYSSGYDSKTSVEDAPFWPSVLGGMPSRQSAVALHCALTGECDVRSTKVSKESTPNSDTEGNSAMEEQSHVDQDDSLDYSIDSTPITRDQKSFLSSKPRIHPALAVDGSRVDLLHVYTSAERRRLALEGGWLGSMPSRNSPLFPMNGSNELNRLMTHVMVFDEESTAITVEGDCVCQEWDSLQYVF